MTLFLSYLSDNRPHLIVLSCPVHTRCFLLGAPQHSSREVIASIVRLESEFGIVGGIAGGPAPTD